MSDGSRNEIDSPTATPCVTGVTAPTDSGESQADAITKYTSPTLTGNVGEDGGQPGDLVNVYIDGDLVNTVIADGDGKWTLPLAATLTEGVHQITARITDIAGNEGPESAALELTVDTIAPNAGLSIMDLEVEDDSGFSSADHITNVNQPTLEGMAEAGTFVTIYDGDLVLGTTVADEDGNWLFAPLLPLPDGDHAITVVAVDLAGNMSAPSAPMVVTIDTQLDNPGGRALTVVTDTGLSDSDGITKLASPVLSGTTVPGGEITLWLDSGDPVFFWADPSTGAWTYTLPEPLSEGHHVVHATVEDPAGNLSGVYDYPIEVDMTPPIGTPIVTGLTERSDSGFSTADRITNNQTPVLVGITETPNALVEVYVDSDLVGIAEADEDGKWLITAAENSLADGIHTVTARETDMAGNTGPWSNEANFVVDTVVAPPVITGITAETDSGDLGDRVTNIERIVLTGTTESHAHVFVYTGDSVLGMAVADENGAWTFSVNQRLELGDNAFRAKAVDIAGNNSGFSATEVITYGEDGGGDPPFVRLIGLTEATDSGFYSRDDYTNDPAPVIHGYGTPNVAIEILADGDVIGSTTIGSDGKWTFAPAGLDEDGVFAISARITDSPAIETGTRMVTIDRTTPPDVPTLTVANSSESGDSDTDGITNNAEPELSGRATAFSAVEILFDGVHAGYTFADENGDWYYYLQPEDPLLSGVYDVTAREVDLAGNVGAESDPIVIDLDADPHAFVTGIAQADDLGISDSDNITSERRPEIHGTAAPNQTFDLLVNDTLLAAVTADEDGNWIYRPTTDLPNGVLDLTASAQPDLAGNMPLDPPVPFTLEVYNPAPAPSIGLAPADDTGVSSTDGLTKNPMPTLQGNTIPNGTVDITVDGGLPTTVVADASGVWKLPQLTPLSDGSHAITTQLRDHPSGAEGEVGHGTITIDTDPPLPAGTITGIRSASDSGDSTSDGITNYAQPTFTGTASGAGELLTLALDGTAIGQVITGAGGAWSFTPKTPIPDGEHVLAIRAVDDAGNDGSSTQAFTIDTTKPSTLVLDLAADRGPGVGNASIYTASSRPVFTGITEPTARVTVYAGSIVLGTAVADALGKWEVSMDAGLALANGSFSVTAKATDVAGNVGEASPAVNVVIDTLEAPWSVAPTVPVLDPAYDTGVLADGSTAISTPAFSGTAGADTWVALKADGDVLGYAKADGNGDWTFTPPASLAPGAHTIVATAVSTTGVQGDSSPSLDLTIEAGAPTLTPHTAYMRAGDSVAIDALFDMVDDDSDPVNVTYTVGLDSDLNDGQLFYDANNNGTFDGGDTALAGGDSFTGADVAAGRIRYTHTGTGDDTLKLTASDEGEGQATASASIHHAPQFTLLALDDAEPAFDFAAFRLAPAADAPASVAIAALFDPVADGADSIPFDPMDWVQAQPLEPAWDDPFHAVCAATASPFATLHAG